jgi:ABC-type transporter Mla subunit MlaD
LALNPDSNDRYNAAIDFVITFLRGHEEKIDELTEQLGTIVEGMGDFGELKTKIDTLNEEVDNLEKQITNLAAILHNREHPNTLTKNRLSR